MPLNRKWTLVVMVSNQRWFVKENVQLIKAYLNAGVFSFEYSCLEMFESTYASCMYWCLNKHVWKKFSDINVTLIRKYQFN